MSIHVRSVSKKDQALSRAPAAVFVLTQEDIRRSGAANIPDLLRLVPGVHVGQIDANTWAISIRGFGSRYSNKVLVLIDGRTVYAPDFSGVFWDHLELPLEDLERIEVIRGPGASVWGANAVNGVISITTKPARATEGGLVSAGAGSQARAAALVQYGDKLGGKGAYRVYGRFTDVADGAIAAGPQAGTNAGDGWRRLHGGFRSDWDLSQRDSLTVQGDFFRNRAGQTRMNSFWSGPSVPIIREDIAADGGNLLTRYNHTFSETSDLHLQMYFDHFARTDLGALESVTTFDVDFQHRLAVGKRNDLVWGAGYRAANSGARSLDSAISVPYRTDALSSVFAQDEIALTGTLSLTVGSKIEHDVYTGFQYEPSARLAWTPTARQTVWVSASRAIRQASREETGANIQLATIPLGQGRTALVTLSGNPDLRPEELRDFELGYRAQVTRSLALDIASFGGLYRHLQRTQVPPPQLISYVPQPQFLVPVRIVNAEHATTYGGEVFANWDVSSRWRLSPGYSFVRLRAEPDNGVLNLGSKEPWALPPSHMFQIRSLFSLNTKTDLDVTLYRVGRMEGDSVPAYNRLDARVGRRIAESGEISVVGQNILSPNHVEFNDPHAVISAQVQRSVYGRITWRF